MINISQKVMQETHGENKSLDWTKVFNQLFTCGKQVELVLQNFKWLQ